MRPSIITLCLLAGYANLAYAEPTGLASRRYLTEFQGSVLKATQFLEYQGESLATCNDLLRLADGLSPNQQVTTRGCSLTRTAPDGSAPPAKPSPEDFYITYDDPALRRSSLRTFTVYHVDQSQT